MCTIVKADRTRLREFHFGGEETAAAIGNKRARVQSISVPALSCAEKMKLLHVQA